MTLLRDGWGAGLDGTLLRQKNADIMKLTLPGMKHLGIYNFLHSNKIKEIRIPVPWHEIEKQPGVYDFTEADKRIKPLQAMDFKVKLVYLWHNAIPFWLKDGVLNPEFIPRFVAYTKQVYARYSWAWAHNLINEILTNAIFVGLQKVWYPYRSSDIDFCTIFLNQVEAMHQAGLALLAMDPNANIMFTGPLEHHQPLDVKSQQHTDFLNARKLADWRLMTGNYKTSDPTFQYFAHYGGLTKEKVKYYQTNPLKIRVYGGHFYFKHVKQWRERTKDNPKGMIEHSATVGLADILLEYWNVIKNNTADFEMSEFSIRGFITDRLAALKIVAEQIDAAILRGVNIRSATWHSTLDTVHWGTLCSKVIACPQKRIDPTGILWLDEYGNWHESEMSEKYCGLARGEITHHDIPGYRFRKGLKKTFGPIRKKFANHWIHVTSKEELNTIHLAIAA